MNNTFSTLGLPQDIAEAVQTLGFQHPTEIQQKVIPHILKNGGDLIALAQTGTGKTAAFGLPLIQKVRTDNNEVHALILCPTRELAIQIDSDIQSYLPAGRQVRTIAIYGGAPIRPQIKALKKGIHIVIGTPGRTLDLIRQKALNVDSIQYLVLDEADEMLNMGFKEELDAILETTPATKNTFLFSATMPQYVRRIASEYMREVTEISAGDRKSSGAQTVEHFYYLVHEKNKADALQRILYSLHDPYCIIFCKTREDTKNLSRKLIKDGFDNRFINGDLSQAQREEVMEAFKNKEFKLLIATDVAARGLDVSQLTHVINVNLPDDPEVYIHRSGRTGRAGNRGVCISIFNTREQSKMKLVEKLLGKQVQLMKMPGKQEIIDAKTERYLNDVLTTSEDLLYETGIPKYLMDIFQNMSKEEVVRHFAGHFIRELEISDFEYIENVNQNKSRDKKNVQGFERDAGVSWKTFFIDKGLKKEMSRGELLQIINRNTPGKMAKIGRLNIQKNYALFEIDASVAEPIINKMQKYNWRGESLFIKEVPAQELDDLENQKKGRSFRQKESKGSRKSHFKRR